MENGDCFYPHVADRTLTSPQFSISTLRLSSGCHMGVAAARQIVSSGSRPHTTKIGRGHTAYQ
jgi:hypothetical protein